MTVENILLDCDPGLDDAAAIFLAAGSPRIHVLGITTVAGNQTIERVTKNAFFVAKMAGMGDVPIARGSARPLLRPQVQVCSEIHGETGLGVPVAEPERDPDPRPAAQFIVDVVMREPEKSVTLVATGPLTNVALAARLEPKLVERVKQVVLRGGACHTGNVGPAMEFNIENDPEAAHIVFNEPWRVVMVGLDLTYQARADKSVRDAFKAIGTPAGDFMYQTLETFAENYKAWRGFDAPPLHDPCAMAYVIDPTVMEVVPVPINVETKGALTAGMTVCDFRRKAPEGRHTFAALKLNVPQFWEMLISSVKAIG